MRGPGPLRVCVREFHWMAWRGLIKGIPNGQWRAGHETLECRQLKGLFRCSWDQVGVRLVKEVA